MFYGLSPGLKKCPLILPSCHRQPGFYFSSPFRLHKTKEEAKASSFVLCIWAHILIENLKGVQITLFLGGTSPKRGCTFSHAGGAFHPGGAFSFGRLIYQTNILVRFSFVQQCHNTHGTGHTFVD